MESSSTTTQLTATIDEKSSTSSAVAPLPPSDPYIIRSLVGENAEEVELYRVFFRSGLKLHGSSCFRLTVEDAERENPFPTALNRPDQFTLGAFSQTTNELLGVVSFKPENVNRVRLAHKGLLFRMYVAPQASRRGIGAALIRTVQERVKRDCPEILQINLTLVSSNDPARLLYERMGFVRYGTEINAIRKDDGTFQNEDFMQYFIPRAHTRVQ